MLFFWKKILYRIFFFYIFDQIIAASVIIKDFQKH